MKKYSVSWLDVWFVYRCDSDSNVQQWKVRFTDSVEGGFSKSKINRAIREYFFKWKDEGVITIIGVSINPSAQPKGVKDWLKDKVGKEIVLSN